MSCYRYTVSIQRNNPTDRKPSTNLPKRTLSGNVTFPDLKPRNPGPLLHTIAAQKAIHAAQKQLDGDLNFYHVIITTTSPSGKINTIELNTHKVYATGMNGQVEHMYPGANVSSLRVKSNELCTLAAQQWTAHYLTETQTKKIASSKCAASAGFTLSMGVSIIAGLATIAEVVRLMSGLLTSTNIGLAATFFVLSITALLVAAHCYHSKTTTLSQQSLQWANENSKTSLSIFSDGAQAKPEETVAIAEPLEPEKPGSTTAVRVATPVLDAQQ